MELKADTSVLLDKVVIYDFKVLDVRDIVQLQKEDIVMVNEKQKFYVILPSGEFFSSLKIEKASYFDFFQYSVSKEGRPYGRLEMSVPDDGFHNLNCLSAYQYQQRVKQVRKYLEDQYGIITDFSNSKFKSMEINKTVVINETFDSYRRPLSLMMYLLPGTLRLKENDFHGKDQHPTKATGYRKEIQTFEKTSGERGIIIKIYDKSEQLKAKYKIQTLHNYLRYEITLKAPEKVRSALGGNEVFNIMDKQVENYFHDFIQKNLVDPYEEYCRKRDIVLRKFLKKYYAPGSRVWIRDVFLEIDNHEIKNGVPLMLEVEELIEQLGCIKFSSKQTRYAAKKRMQEICESKSDVYGQHDGEKYRELLEKLSDAI